MCKLKRELDVASPKTKKYLDKLPDIYLVVELAKKWFVKKYKFTGKYTEDGIPLVYYYFDFNGEIPGAWYLRPINRITGGFILTWTEDENAAYFLVSNATKKAHWVESERGCVITCSECNERLELYYPDGTEVRRLDYCPSCGARMLK